MFLSTLFGSGERAATSDESRPPAADNDFWYGPTGGGSSAAGQHVTANTAMRIGTVYACVRILAETVAQLPLNLHRRTDAGGREKVTDHPLSRVLHTKPNAGQTSFSFREQLQSHMALRGNAYAEIIEDRRGNITELRPMLPDDVRPEKLPEGRLRYKVRRPGGQTETMVRDQVLHIPALSWDGLIGLNPIEAYREGVGIALAAQDYGARFYANDTRPRGVIEMEGSFASDEQAAAFDKRWKKQAGGAARHSTMLLNKGMSYKPISMSMVDAQYIEQRKFQDIDIVRMFRIPPHMAAILDRATFSNMEQQALEFLAYTMLPWLTRWEHSLNAQLLPPDGDLFFKFQVKGLLRGATEARYKSYHWALTDGWMTRNEVRELEDLNPEDGLDEFLQPLNMGQVGDMDGGDASGDGGDRKEGTDDR